MKKRYFVSSTPTHFSDTSKTITGGKHFFVAGEGVYSFSLSTAKVEQISSMGNWVVDKLFSGGYIEETTSKDFNNAITEESKPKQAKVVNSTTTYQEIVTSVDPSVAIKRTDAHKAFSQPLATYKMEPAKSGSPSTPRVESRTIKSSVLKPEKFNYEIKSGTSRGQEITARYTVVDVPEGQKPQKLDTSKLNKDRNEEGVIIQDRIEVLAPEDKALKSYTEKWETYMGLKKGDKLEFIESLTYSEILNFFIDRTLELIGGGTLTKNFVTMHTNLVEIMEKQLKVPRHSL